MKQRATTTLRRWIAARCSPENAFGLHLTLGMLVLMIAVAIFASVAVHVMGGSATLASIDRDVGQWLQGHAAPALTLLMLVITHLHGVTGITVLGLLLCAWFWREKAHYWLLTAILAIPGGMLLNVLLKHVFMRPRPASDEALLALATYSFPSGHTVAATLFYGVLGVYLVRAVRSLWLRSAIIAAALLMVMLVGASRIFLGVHYFSDVFAAVVEGCGWLAISLTVIRILDMRMALVRASRAASAGR
jgi:membrane-associated phospholipid phosphatase